MRAVIRDILLISAPEDIESFKRLLGDGSAFGVRLNYAVQAAPDGIAQAFVIGEEFIGQGRVCLVLGDTIFYGRGFSSLLHTAVKRKGATVFGYQVKDPERFGVVDFSDDSSVLSIEENTANPKSSYSVTCFYLYDTKV